MLRGNRLYILAFGLSVLAPSAANTQERAPLNENILYCAIEGCVAFRYVPKPRLKPEQEIVPHHDYGKPQSKGAAIPADDYNRDADKPTFSSINETEAVSEQSDSESAKPKEKDKSPIKWRAIMVWLWGLFSTAEALTAWGTIAAAVIAGVAVHYLKGTLRASQRAEENTSKMLVAQTRPWLLLSVDEVFVGDFGASHNKKVTVWYQVTNHGKGPALNIVTEMKVIDTGIVRLIGIDNEAVFSFYLDCKEKYALVSSANMNSLLPLPDLGNTGHVDEVISLPVLDELGLGLGERKFNFAICATYKDAMGEVHQTGVRIRAIDRGPYLTRVDGSTWTEDFSGRNQPVSMDAEVMAEGSYHT